MINNSYLCTLLSYEHNKSHLEGSIVDWYIVEECTTFCSRVLYDVKTKFNCEERNYINLNETIVGGLSIFKCMGHSLGKSTCLVSCNELKGVVTSTSIHVNQLWISDTFY